MKLHAHGPPASVTAAALVLLSCHAILQTVTYAQIESDGRDSEENIDPEALARELRAEICASNSTQVENFYRKIIEGEARNVTYPPEHSKQLSNRFY